MPKARRVLKKQEREPVRPIDRLVVGLALLGLAIAGYLTVLKLGGQQAIFCRQGGGCDIVQSSRFALLAGVPTALWGAGLYAAVLVLGLLPHTARRWRAMFLLTSGAVAFSAYLTYLSIAVIGGTCVYCLASGVIAVLLLVAIVARRPRPGPRSPWRLAGLGSMAGAVAILAGAFMFAWEGPAPASYTTALAEHLTQSRAIFYGAYW